MLFSKNSLSRRESGVVAPGGREPVFQARAGSGSGRLVNHVSVTAAVLFVLFLGYYLFTAWHLPRGAGPDSSAHYDVGRFIYENGRLPVIPDDVGRLKLTPYGSTRALRPPLSYLVSAGTAWIASATGMGHDSTFINLRFGSGLLCAAATVFLFFGLWLLFERYWIALCGALLFGLLPQLAFIASYINDDSGAIFSGTLLWFALIRVLVKGLNTSTAAVFGLAMGVVLLSKFTAWLMLPLAACFLVPYLWKESKRGLRFVAVICIAVVIGGGWWIPFNMYHYGVDDPLLSGVSTRLSEERAAIADAGHRGYVSRGVGLTELILGNYKNFLGESYIATVGHLDWLRIRLGWLQYGLYAMVFLIGIVYLPLRKLREWIGISGHYDPREPAGATWFYSVLFLMVVFQVVMYIRFNLYHDVQVQGKYLLPVLAPLLTLFAGAVVAATRVREGPVKVLDRLPGTAWAALFAGLVVVTHVHALRTYVIPYYFPDPLVYRMSSFRYLDLGNLNFIKTSSAVKLEPGESGLTVESLGIDPQIELRNKFCKWIPVNFIIHMIVEAESKGDIKVYVDSGQGYSEENVVGSRYYNGENHLIIPMGVSGCRAIRIDPASAPGKVVLRRIGFASFHISQ